jgi:tetratricopeptide (TPR) repeat protein/DNA-binding winged helix-turn-helix (wHTH) protein
MTHRRIPAQPALLVGRDTELAHLESMLASVSTALVYGVAGVGKSALLYALAGRFSGRVVYTRAQTGDSLATIVDDIRRQLAKAPIPEIDDDGDRLLDLAKSLDAENALWAIDDFERIDEDARETIVRTLSAQLRSGRLVATSRVLVARAADDLDRIEVKLTGLDESSARALWARLDELYGASGGFDLAWPQSSGNPFYLRQAHAGGLDAADPIAHAVDALGADERCIAAAMALASSHLQSAQILDLLPEERSRDALERLHRQLLVELDGSGTCVLHDVVRERVLAALSAEERDATHARLADVLSQSEIDPIVRGREVCRHLHACRRYDAMDRYLVMHAVAFVRNGAARELFDLIERVPADGRSPDIRLVRARTLLRLLETRRAVDELEAMVASGDDRVEVKLALANAAFLAGELDRARTVLEELAASQADAPADTHAAARACILHALVRTYQGEGTAAREQLRTYDLTTSGAVGPNNIRSVYIRAAYAFTCWVDERNEEAEVWLRRAAAAVPEAAPSFRVRALVPALLSSVLAAVGKHEESDASYARAVELGHEPRLRAYLRAMRATFNFETGKRDEALDELTALTAAFVRGGETLGALWAQAWTGRALLVVGRVAEGREILDDVESRARLIGAFAIAETARRGRGEDAVARFRGLVPPSWIRRGTANRAALVDALAAAASGDVAEGRARLAPIPMPSIRRDHALDRALVHLVRAAIARAVGRDEDMADQIMLAKAEASSGGVDALAIDELVGVIADTRVVVSTTVPSEAPPTIEAAMGAIDEFETVLDGRSHELRDRGRVVSLKRSKNLRAMLYALARTPGTTLAKEDLAGRLWAARYSPYVHDNALWVNVRRLRTAIEGTSLRLDSVPGGYTLRVPDRFIYIEPNASDDARRSTIPPPHATASSGIVDRSDVPPDLLSKRRA